MWRVGVMPSDSNNQVNILLSFDTNGIFAELHSLQVASQRILRASCPLGKLSQTGKTKETAEEDLLQTPAEAQQQLWLLLPLPVPSHNSSRCPDFQTRIWKNTCRRNLRLACGSLPIQPTDQSIL